ncbi:MAG: leucine-rich repeat protein, partial [Olsenella sp.]
MVSSGVSQLRPDARDGGPRETGDAMSAAKRFLSLFLSAALVVGMSPDCAYAKVTAQMLRAAASQLPSPAQGDGAPQAAPEGTDATQGREPAQGDAPQATLDGTGAAQGQESAQDDAPQAAPDGAETAQGDAPAGAGGQAAGSQSADQGDGLSWREAEGGVEVTGYAGDETDLAIPSELGGRPVVGIAASAFRGCTSLRSVSLPPTVESVGDGAFSGCSSLA